MIDEGQIRKWWNIFRPDNALEEIRFLKPVGGTISGYFTDIDTLLTELRRYADNKEGSFYFILNTISPGCYYRRQRNKLCFVGRGETTDDNSIERRRWLLIDIDPKKHVDGIEIKGINSSEEELQSARKVARTIFDYLNGNGFPMPITAMSGNGIHIYYKIDEPNDKETTELITKFLHSLAQKFTTNEADVDTGVWTAARLSKLYGTIPHKGADTPDRPCRMAVIEYVPNDITLVTRELIKKVADEYEDPKEKERQEREKRRQQPDYHSDEFPDVSVRDFLDRNGISYNGPEYDSKRGAMRYDLIVCPWESEHTTHSKPGHASIWEYPSGHKDFHCFHGHCNGRKWEDVWRKFDPNLYKDAWREQFGKKGTSSAPTPVKIEKEDTDDNNVWLHISEIEDVDIDQLEKVNTLFYSLDSVLHGLFMGELTILSGINGSGKSSWLNTLILNVIQQNFKVALWTGELQGFKIRNWLLMCAAGNHVRPSERLNGTYYVPNNTKGQIVNWLDDKLVIFDNKYPAKWEKMSVWIREIIRQGYRFVVLDNLFALDLGDTSSANESQKDFILSLTKIAKEENAHIVLVAHPRKVVTFLRKEDILGSSALQNAVDNILIIHRNGTDFMKRASEFYSKKVLAAYEGFGNIIEIVKNRLFGATEVLCGLYYVPSCRRFTEKAGKIIAYGWCGNGEEIDAFPLSYQHNNDMPFPIPNDDDVAPF